MKQWYSHLVKIETIIIELDTMNLSKEEKKHLAQLVDSNMHHTILNAILSHLNEADKRVLIMYLNEGNHDKIWKFLNQKIDNVEDKIKKVAQDLKHELHKDLKEAKKN